MTYHAPLDTPVAFNGPNEPIRLASETAQLFQGSMLLLEGKTDVDFRWAPYPAVALTIAADAWRSFPDFDGEDFSVVAKTLGTLPVNMIRTELGSAVAVVHVRDRIEIGDASSIDELRFMIPNWDRMEGEWIRRPGEAWRGHVEINHSPWRLIIQPRVDLSTVGVLAGLRAQSGYMLTHVGSLSHTDGSPLAVDDAIEELAHFFGFARGFWTPPLFATGYTGGNPTWREWIPRTASPWRGNRTWFEPLSVTAFEEAFAKFSDAWRNPLLTDPLRILVSWFVEANGPAAAHTSMLIGQVALELLSWVALVEQQKVMSKKAFEGLGSAEAKIRAFLKWANIDPSVPSDFQQLEAFRVSEGLTDGLQALVRYRNKLVHTTHRASSVLALDPMASVQLRELAIQFVELGILRLISYREDYVDRASWSAFTTGRVPWA